MVVCERQCKCFPSPPPAQGAFWIPRIPQPLAGSGGALCVSGERTPPRGKQRARVRTGKDIASPKREIFNLLKRPGEPRNPKINLNSKCSGFYRRLFLCLFSLPLPCQKYLFAGEQIHKELFSPVDPGKTGVWHALWHALRESLRS